MAQAWRVVLNPADKTSGYILWTNGRIDTFGAAVPAVSSGAELPGAAGYPVWYNDPNNPEPAVALTITNWQAPGGYTTHYFGSPEGWGGATTPDPGTVPETRPLRIVPDAQMNPDGSGQGYYLRIDGLIVPVGNAASIGSATLLAPIAKRLLIDWPTLRFYVLTQHGGIFSGNGATPPPPAGVPNILADWARDFYMDFATGGGMVLGYDGVIRAFGGIELPFGNPRWPTGDVARGLGVISDGTGGQPMTLSVLDLNGNLHTFTSSTVPTVTAGGPSNLPPDPETDTSRPTLPWSYTQPQGDAQASWKVRVYPRAIPQLAGFDPDGSAAEYALFVADGTDATSRSVTPAVDLPNEDLIFYVQATSTAGLSSAWGIRQWTQQVTLPEAPTLSVQTGMGDGTVALTVTTPVGAEAGFIRVEYVDQDGAVQTVRGLGAFPVVGNQYLGLIDREAPIGQLRYYSATYYRNSPSYVASLPSPTVTAMADGTTFLLNTPTNYGGGPVCVTGAFVRTRHARGGTFLPAGRLRAVRISDGPPSSMSGTLTVTGFDSDQTAELEAMFASDLTLLFRDTHGHVNYLAVTGNVALTRVEAGDANYIYTYAVDVTEVDRPPG